MELTEHPFCTLRRKIRYAGRQFRREDDNSQSLFNPKGGFVNAYDIEQVEAALDDYAATLPNGCAESLMDKLLRKAAHMENYHPSADARELAHELLEFLRPLTKPALYEEGGSKVTVLDWETEE